jgi:thiol-disulfide isomerase/thioredoxin
MIPSKTDGMTQTPPEPKSGARWRKYLYSGAALALVAVLYGIGRGARKETTASAECPGVHATLSRLAPLARGDAAAFNPASDPSLFPDVEFQGPDGKPRHVSDFRGKTILLNLWATWCVPCRQEMPALDKLQARLGGSDFQVVAVDVDTARLDRRQPFLHQMGIRSLAFYADPTAQILRSLKEAGPVIGLPTSFLLGSQGCRLGTVLGPANWASADATNLISAALTKPEPKG